LAELEERNKELEGQAQKLMEEVTMFKTTNSELKKQNDTMKKYDFDSPTYTASFHTTTTRYKPRRPIASGFATSNNSRQSICKDTQSLNL